MDCQTFLQELKDCYKINGLDLPEGMIPNYRRASNRSAPRPAVSCELKCKSKPYEPPYVYAKVANSYASFALKNFPNPMSKQKVKIFADFKDMVYTLAWELSERIGRLPDSLHARMILSTDNHPLVKSYVWKWGV